MVGRPYANNSKYLLSPYTNQALFQAPSTYQFVEDFQKLNEVYTAVPPIVMSEAKRGK